MFLSRKEIEDEYQKFYDDLKNNQYNSNKSIKKSTYYFELSQEELDEVFKKDYPET